MANGGIRRFLQVSASMLGLAAASQANQPAPAPPTRNSHHADRVDVNLGYWSYARKGKRTAAQQKRAALKKRNRARSK